MKDLGRLRYNLKSDNTWMASQWNIADVCKIAIESHHNPMFLFCPVKDFQIACPGEIEFPYVNDIVSEIAQKGCGLW